MLRLSKLTDYGMVLMTALARHPAQLRNAADLASETRISPPTVSKLLKRLVRAGLVESARGAQGGYRLSRAPANIHVAELIRVLEGPIGLTECATDDSRCNLENSCNVRGNWQLINSAIRQALSDISLQQMVDPLAGLKIRIEPPALRAAARPTAQR